MIGKAGDWGGLCRREAQSDRSYLGGEKDQSESVILVLVTSRLSGLKGRGQKPKVLVWVVRRVKMSLTEMEKSGGGGGVRGGGKREGGRGGG